MAPVDVLCEVAALGFGFRGLILVFDIDFDFSGQKGG